MPFALWTLLCLVAYIGGLVLLLRVTPYLLLRSYDEGLFLVVAVADVIGGMLAFGGVVIIYGIFGGNFGSRVLDFLLLIGILVVGGRVSLGSFRPRYYSGTYLASRIIAGSYGLFLALAALFYIVMLFIPAS